MHYGKIAMDLYFPQQLFILMAEKKVLKKAHDREEKYENENVLYA